MGWWPRKTIANATAGSVLLNTITSPGNQVIELGASTAGSDFTLIDDPFLLTTPAPLTVVDAVKVGDGHALTLIAPTLTLAAAGSLTANAVAPASPGTVTPSLVALQADAMSLKDGTIVAQGGVVALAPLSADQTFSLDAATQSGHLSLTPADLSKITTTGAFASGQAPRGTQTLVLGSLDGEQLTPPIR